MKLTAQNKAMLASYARTAISAGIAVYLAGNHDVKAIGAAAFAAISGPLMRWLNPSDPAFGRGAK
jgi:hypothetical protein